MDENTSTDATKYEAHKGYFTGIEKAGGVPIGLGYVSSAAAVAFQTCHGLLITGGRVAFPAGVTVVDRTVHAPASERTDPEAALLADWLAADLPYFGICHGMQLLAGLTGSTMSGDLLSNPGADRSHNDPEAMHAVMTLPGTQLASITGAAPYQVNTLHNACVLQVAKPLKVSAVSEDGIIEAVEDPNRGFCIGVQWHPERLAYAGDAEAQALFNAFVAACRHSR